MCVKKLYKCNICNYQTSDRGNIFKHKKTKKHKKNELIFNSQNSTISKDSQRTPIGLPKKSSNIGEQKKKSNYVCEYCKSSFTRRNNLGRHLQTCIKKKQIDEENEFKKKLKLKEKEMELKEKEMEYKNKELEKNKEELKHYKEEVEYYRSIINVAGSVLQRSMSSFSFVSTNFINAPKIEKLKESEIKLLEQKNNEFVDLIIYYHNHKTLNQFIGDYIIKVYKKEKPEEQSIWNTDSSRLTYIIKDLINKESSKWKIDKKGVKTTNFLIDPVLEYIKKLIDKKKMELIESINQTENNDISLVFERIRIISEINKSVNDGILSNDILKYISPYFYFDKENIKKIELVDTKKIDKKKQK